MRKLMLILASCSILCSQVLMANWFNCCNPCDCCEGWPAAGYFCPTDWPCFKMDIGGGFRNDRFEWSIAGLTNIPGTDEFIDFPDTASELQWKDLRMAQVGGNASFVSCRNYVLYAAAEYGRIYHGKVIDSDYLLDDKEGLFSRSRSKADKGHVYDLSTAAGYRVTSTCGRFIAHILAGYSQHQQYLHMIDGKYTFLFAPCHKHILGLNSTYTTRWYGPWIGIDFETRVERCAYMFGGVEWHMLAYRGHGHWNLRPDISRFNHKAPGWGYIVRLGGKWEIWNRWSLGVVGYYRMFRTKRGLEHICIHSPDFDGPIRVRLRFNGAQWHNYAVSGILSLRF